MGAIDFDAGGFEAEIFDIADDADGEDHALGGNGFGLAVLGLERRGDAVFALLELLDGRADLQFHALLGESLGGEGGDLLVLHRQHAVQHFDHRHLGAQRAVEAGELDADGAGADDEQRFGKGWRHHRLAIGPDPLAVGLHARKGAGARAGGEHDVLRGDLVGLAVLRHRQLALAGELRVARDDGDLVLLHQEGDAVRQLLRHLARAFDDLGDVELHVVGAEAELVQPVHQVPDLGRAQQRLGRDAAPVQTDAAEAVALHDGGLEAELRAPDGADIAARTRSHHDDVIGISQTDLRTH